MKKKNWEHYSHTADMGVRGFGATKEEAFAAVALALVAVSFDLKKIRQDQLVEIACEEEDDELLLVRWLNCLLDEMTARKMLFSKFAVAIKGKMLTATAWGEKLNLQKHKPAVEIKGITYSDLKVRQNENGKWTAQCIVDI
jgi:tRNA nucleotidyltransferase (CCA-adding enzyme)